MSALFPELEVPEVPEVPTVPTVNVKAPGRPRRTPAECIDRFRRALALPAGMDVTDVLLHDDSVRIVTKRGETVRRIALNEPGARAWKRTPGFGLAVEGKEIEPDLAAALERFLARYRGARLESFQGLVRSAIEESDRAEALVGAGATPARKTDGDGTSTAWNDLPTASRRSDEETRTGSTEVWNDHDGSRAAKLDEPDALRLSTDQSGALFYSYGARAGWRTFFEEHDLYRGGCSHIEGRVATVMHREIECTYNLAPPTAWGRGSFGALADDRGNAQEGLSSILLDTDLGDRDVILGGDARLDAAFDAIAAMPTRPDLVLVQSTCVPVVTGDDLDASAERARRKHRLPIAVLGYLEHPVASAVVQMVEEVSTRERALQPVALLIGMPRVQGLEALQRLLIECGARLLGPVIPDMPQETRNYLESAAVLVTYDEPHTRHDVGRVLERLRDRRVITPPPPFSPEASRLFGLAVASALGVTDAFTATWEAHRAAWEPRWEVLRARAARYTLGFVSDRADWRQRLTRRLGVPLLETVLAMGFAVEVLAYAKGDERVPESDDPRVTVRAFTRRDELDALLRASSASLVYSEVRYDPRVHRTGHGGFSLEDLRAGPQGATEALESLLRRCETPWFRRYGKHAGRAFHEERRG